MRKIFFLVIIAFLVLSIQNSFAKQNTSLSIDKNSIDVNLWYNGTGISVKGKLPTSSHDVIMILSSAKNPPVNIIKKEKIYIFWTPLKKVIINNLPYVYQIAASSPLKDITVEKTLTGYEYLRNSDDYKAVNGNSNEADKKLVFDELIKLKEKNGLYSINNGVKIETDGTFNYNFNISDNFNSGLYKITAYTLKNKVIKDKIKLEFEIKKQGLIKLLNEMNRDNSVAYAVIAIIVAVFGGIFSNLISSFGKRILIKK